MIPYAFDKSPSEWPRGNFLGTQLALEHLSLGAPLALSNHVEFFFTGDCMSVLSLCPRCGTEIKHANVGLAVCKCGWSDESHLSQERVKAEKKVVNIMLIASVLLALGYMHLVSW